MYFKSERGKELKEEGNRWQKFTRREKLTIGANREGGGGQTRKKNET